MNFWQFPLARIPFLYLSHKWLFSRHQIKFRMDSENMNVITLYTEIGCSAVVTMADHININININRSYDKSVILYEFT